MAIKARDLMQIREIMRREKGCQQAPISQKEKIVNAINLLLLHCEQTNLMDTIKAPYSPGDILYVRETWATYCINKKHCPNHLLGHSDYCFKASPESAYYGCVDDWARETCKWRPSIHMPKEAARIFLRVKSVRVERLRDMVLADVLMEGIAEGDTYDHTWQRWHNTWNSTIKPADLPTYGWEANPWVWVIKFERISKEETNIADSKV